VVTISNELGEPRFPGARDKMAARKKQAVEMSVADLGLTDEQLTPGVVLAKQYLPEVHGHCEFIEGAPAAAAAALIGKLRADKLI
jgi:electron transfer flavoprotein beta subunit